MLQRLLTGYTMLSVQLSLSEEAEAKLTIMEMTGVDLKFRYGKNDETELHVNGHMHGERIDRCYFSRLDPSDCVLDAFEYYLGSRELHGKS